MNIAERPRSIGSPARCWQKDFSGDRGHPDIGVLQAIWGRAERSALRKRDLPWRPDIERDAGAPAPPTQREHRQRAIRVSRASRIQRPRAATDAD